jgi:hypothetical protein
MASTRPRPLGPRRIAAPPVDPAADAAGLLRRVGFAILTVLLPSSALLTRRGVVVLAPIGVALLVLSAVLDRRNRPMADSLQGLAFSRTGFAAAIVLLWCALSLMWTPFLAPASERLLNIVATLGLALAGYLALPDRMRAANLYLVPVGVGIAAVLALGLILLSRDAVQPATEASQNLERGLTVLVLFLWPAVSWLRSRQRDLQAIPLAAAVAAAVLLSPHSMPKVAFLVGALVLVLTTAAPRRGVRLTGAVMAGLLALAPVIPFLLRPIANHLFDEGDPNILSLGLWRRIVLSEPVRLITGHGFETALRGRLVGLLHPAAPNSLLFEAWYELGIVGALAGAAAIYFAVAGAGRDEPPLVPGTMAAFATVFTFATLGIGTAQMWWFTAVSVMVLTFVATERGEFRTTRPKAIFIPRAANDR